MVGKAGKPTVVLDKDFGLWLLNPGDAKIKVPCSELCGFGTGAYKNGVVSDWLSLVQRVSEWMYHMSLTFRRAD